MKIYLDACCLSRLTDDQSQVRIRDEAAAVVHVLEGVGSGIVELVSSEALEDEVLQNPSLERRMAAETLLRMAVVTIQVDDAIALRARDLENLGYDPYDGLHIAVSESAGVDALLTTDDRLLRRVGRGLGKPQVQVLNPVSWWKGQSK